MDKFLFAVLMPSTTTIIVSVTGDDIIDAVLNLMSTKVITKDSKVFFNIKSALRYEYITEEELSHLYHNVEVIEL